MPQLPKVAVVGDDSRADAVCAALVDSGLDAVRTAARGLGPGPSTSPSDGDGELGGSFDVTVAVGHRRGDGERRFGGVFAPGQDGHYVVGGGLGDTKAGAQPSSQPALALAQELSLPVALAQARWLSEYLRGRYLLPQASVMLSELGLPRTSVFSRSSGGGTGYLNRLARELHRGRARAAAAGYPLPVPSTTPDRVPQPGLSA